MGPWGQVGDHLPLSRSLRGQSQQGSPSLFSFSHSADSHSESWLLEPEGVQPSSSPTPDPVGGVAEVQREKVTWYLLTVHRKCGPRMGTQVFFPHAGCSHLAKFFAVFLCLCVSTVLLPRPPSPSLSSDQCHLEPHGAALLGTVGALEETVLRRPGWDAA